MCCVGSTPTKYMLCFEQYLAGEHLILTTIPDSKILISKNFQSPVGAYSIPLKPQFTSMGGKKTPFHPSLQVI